MFTGSFSKHRARRLASATLFIAASVSMLRGQDLSPRAYVITPLHSNAVIVTYAYFSGSLLFNGAAPVTGATGTYSVPILAYYHSFGFFSRSSNFNVALPYAVGTFQGSVVGVNEKIYRSGLVDTTFRVAVNLKGGAALHAKEFGRWKERTLLGASLKLVAPTGQYDPARLINWGSNRWAFKPEFGYSRRVDRWVLDAYAGAWFFTDNQQFCSPSGPKVQTERPIGSLEGHLSYDVRPRLWFSLDGNFWFGGLTSLNGLDNVNTRQTSSRIGLTASLPVSKHQSVKLSYNNGAYTRFGGNYQNISAAWQYSWLGRQ
jgi:hypothetical protein